MNVYYVLQFDRSIERNVRTRTPIEIYFIFMLGTRDLRADVISLPFFFWQFKLNYDLEKNL